MKSVLFIRGGAIGDFILTLPGMALLRKKYPEAKFEILGYPHIAKLASTPPYKAQIRSLDQRGMAHFFAKNGDLDAGISQWLRSFDQVISFLYDPDQIFTDNLQKAGVSSLICNHGRPGPGMHAVHQLAEWTHAMKLEGEILPPQIDPSAESLKKIQSLPFFDDLPKSVAVHIGSGAPYKNWPIERFIQVITWLNSQRHPVLLIQGPADQTVWNEFQRQAQGLSFHTWNSDSLLDLAAVLSTCRLFLGHDSGISHLAAACKIPVIVMFGPTDSTVWRPRGKVTIIQKGLGISSIRIEDVKGILQRQLETT